MKAVAVTGDHGADSTGNFKLYEQFEVLEMLLLIDVLLDMYFSQKQ